jgi:hypothetical protein
VLGGVDRGHSWQGRRWLDPFFAELWIWPDYNGYYQGPLSVWVCEVIVGLAVLAWVGMPRRRIRLRDKIASPGSNPAGRIVMGWRPTLRPP